MTLFDDGTATLRPVTAAPIVKERRGLFRNFNPRFQLAAAIGWAIACVTLLCAFAAAFVASYVAENRVRHDTEQLLTQYATQARHAVAMQLSTHTSILQATAAQIVASADRGADALSLHLQAVRAEFPDFAWLGVADAQGRVMAAIGPPLETDSVAQRAWFQQGRTAATIVTPTNGVAQGLGPIPNASPLSPQIVTLAVPITHNGGPNVEGHPGMNVGVNVGVLGAHLSQTWLGQLRARLLTQLTTNRALELFFTAEDGTVIAGPVGSIGKTMAEVRARDTDNWLESRSAAQDATGRPSMPRWNVVVRETAYTALAPARGLRNTVFTVVLLSGMVGAVIAIWLAHILTRRLGALAQQTSAVRRGERQNISPPTGRDEVHQIGTVLADTIHQLQQEKHALADLNAALDARVAERSARIERLADEARAASLVRERLRIARELHDTLAHSLMALLTQIRLARKLRDRMAPHELDEELGRAEQVAADGLTEARAAITEMRHNGAGEIGLGNALQDLLSRFSGRSAIDAQLHADPVVAQLAGDRAETIFRIVEEALRNVARHAQASQALVVLTQRVAHSPDLSTLSATMCVEISDNGVGFDVRQKHPGHYGLNGIHEQAALLGAQLTIESRAGQGTRIRLEFAL